MPKKTFGLRALIALLLIAVLVVIALYYWMHRKPSASADVNLKGNRNVATDQYVPGEILVKFKSNTSKEKKDKFIADYKLKQKKEISQIGLEVLTLPGEGTEKEYEKAFKANKDVEYAELNYIVDPSFTPNDPGYADQWHLRYISAPGAWDKTLGNENIIIAVTDSGVDTTHPDLASKIVPGWNVINNNSTDVTDVMGHGSAVAGTAAAITNNSIGVASVCPNCKIMPVRVTNYSSGSANSSALTEGIIWAADHGARVVNQSYGTCGYSSVQSAGQYLQSKGGLLTVAAGNGSNLSTSANSPSLVCVSATDTNDNLASFSTYGDMIDVSAPGNPIYTTDWNHGYSGWYGTSFSSPIVAGVMGMIFSANPSLTPTQAENILKTTADDKGMAGWDNKFGWGRVNLQKAVEAALAGPAPDTTAPTVSFTSPANGATVANTIDVKISAVDNIAVSTVRLAIDGIDQGALSGTGTYTYSLDTNGLTNGTHSFTATATDTSANKNSATVTVNVLNTPDTISPTAAITSPSEGSSVGKSVSISVTAADNVAVTRVEIFIDGVLYRTLTSTPYSYTWNTGKISSGTHTIYAKAYDAKGNVGTSATISVTKSGGGPKK